MWTTCITAVLLITSVSFCWGQTLCSDTFDDSTTGDIKGQSADVGTWQNITTSTTFQAATDIYRGIKSLKMVRGVSGGTMQLFPPEAPAFKSNVKQIVTLYFETFLPTTGTNRCIYGIGDGITSFPVYLYANNGTWYLFDNGVLTNTGVTYTKGQWLKIKIRLDVDDAKNGRSP